MSTRYFIKRYVNGDVSDSAQDTPNPQVNNFVTEALNCYEDGQTTVGCILPLI